MRLKKTFNKLVELAEDIKFVSKKFKEEKYNFDLVLTLRENLKTIREKLETIKETFKDDVNGFNEFEKKRFAVFIDNGAKPEKVGNGYAITSEGLVGVNAEKIEKDLKDLGEEYKEVVEKQNKINQENDKIRETKEVEVELISLKREWFPEAVSFEEFPESFLDLIEINKENGE